MKPAVHILYLAVIVALSAYAWLRPSSNLSILDVPPAELSAAAQEVVSDSVSPEVAAYIEKLELEVKGLRKALQNEIAVREQKEQADDVATRSSTTVATADSSARQSTEGRPMIDARDVHTLFAEEEIDPVWSAQHEQRLIDLMITDEGLRKYSVGDVQCKTDTCRLTFYDDIEDPSVFTRELSRAVFQSNWDEQRFVTIMQQSDDDGAELTLYLKKME